MKTIIMISLIFLTWCSYEQQNLQELEEQKILFEVQMNYYDKLLWH